MDSNQVLVPPPLTKERVARVRARIAAIHEGLRQQGIDMSRVADPVEMLRQARDAETVEPLE